MFVAIRISEIQRLSNSDRWFHVSINDYPADFITGGISLKELKNHNIQWLGPQHILTQTDPIHSNHVDDKSEQKVISLSTNLLFHQSIFDRFSSLSKLINVIAYCLRFISTCKTHKRTIGELTKTERTMSLKILIKLSQQQAFESELNQLRKDKIISTSSSILSLNPFIDNDGLIRVEGQLNNVNINYDQKHQVLLQKKSQTHEINCNRNTRKQFAL